MRAVPRGGSAKSVPICKHGATSSRAPIRVHRLSSDKGCYTHLNHPLLRHRHRRLAHLLSRRPQAAVAPRSSTPQSISTTPFLPPMQPIPSPPLPWRVAMGCVPHAENVRGKPVLPVETDACYKRVGQDLWLCRPLAHDGSCHSSPAWSCPGDHEASPPPTASPLTLPPAPALLASRDNAAAQHAVTLFEKLARGGYGRPVRPATSALLVTAFGMVVLIVITLIVTAVRSKNQRARRAVGSTSRRQGKHTRYRVRTMAWAWNAPLRRQKTMRPTRMRFLEMTARPP